MATLKKIVPWQFSKQNVFSRLWQFFETTSIHACRYTVMFSHGKCSYSFFNWTMANAKNKINVYHGIFIVDTIANFLFIVFTMEFLDRYVGNY